MKRNLLIPLLALASVLTLNAQGDPLYYIGGDHTYVGDESDPTGDLWTFARGGTEAEAGLRPIAGDSLINEQANSNLTFSETISLSADANSVYLVNAGKAAQMTIGAHIQGMATNSGQGAIMTVTGSGNTAWQLVNSGTDSIMRIYSTGDADTGILASNMQNRGQGSILEFYSKAIIDSKGMQDPINPSRVIQSQITNANANSSIVFKSGADVTVASNGDATNIVSVQSNGAGSSLLMDSGSKLTAWNEIQLTNDNVSFTLSEGALLNLAQLNAALVIRTATAANSTIDIRGTIEGEGKIYVRDTTNAGNLINIASTADVTVSTISINNGSTGKINVEAGAQITSSGGILIAGANAALAFDGTLNTGNITFSGANATGTIGANASIAGNIYNNGSGSLLTVNGGSIAGTITNSANALMQIEEAGSVAMTQLFNHGTMTFSGTQTLSGTEQRNVLENKGANAKIVFAEGSNTYLGTYLMNNVYNNGAGASMVFENGSTTTFSKYLSTNGANSVLDIQAGAVVATEQRLQINGTDAQAVVSGTFNVGNDIELSASGATLTVKDGGVVNVGSTFFGIRGNNFSADAHVEGGHMTVNGNFTLAGNDAAQTNTFSFNQTGGTVHIVGNNNGTAFLRLTYNSSTSTGIYNLSDGVLIVNSTHGNALGITYGLSGQRTGDGKGGQFNWTGGTLATSKIDINLDNLGTGRLEVGGIGTVGIFQMASAVNETNPTNTAIGGGLTYHQGADASVAFDILDKDNYDQIIWQNKEGFVGDKAQVILDNGTTLIFNGSVDTSITYTVITADSLSVGDSLSIYVNGELDSGATWQKISESGVDYLAVNLTIPEPSMAAGLLGLLALGMAMRRRI